MEPGPFDKLRRTFVHDQLSNSQKFRMLTVMDVFSRKALAIEVGQRFAVSMLSMHSIARCVSAEHRDICSPTMAANLPVGSSIYGLTTVMFGSTSAVRGNRRITPISRHLTGRCATSA